MRGNGPPRHLSLAARHHLSSILIVMFGALMIGAGDLTMGQLIAVSMLAALGAHHPGHPDRRPDRALRADLPGLEALDKIMESPTDEGAGQPAPCRAWRAHRLPRHPLRLPGLGARAEGLNLTIRPASGSASSGASARARAPCSAAAQPLQPRPGRGAGRRHGRQPARTPEPAPPDRLRAPGRGALPRRHPREHPAGGRPPSDTQLIETLRLSLPRRDPVADAQRPRHPGGRTGRPPLRRPASGRLHRPRAGPPAAHAAARRALQHDGPGHRGPPHRQPAQHQGRHDAAGHPPYGHAAAGGPAGGARPGPRRDGRPAQRSPSQLQGGRAPAASALPPGRPQHEAPDETHPPACKPKPSAATRTSTAARARRC